MLRARAAAALPPVKGEVRVAGLQRPVEVRWDAWGVPHIRAENLHDLYFAQGYVVASERLFQLDFSLRLATGRLSGLFGELALPFDRFVRTVGWNRAGVRLLRGWDDLSLEIAEAAIEGIRAWIERMPARPVEYDLIQADPSVPEGGDALAAASAAAVFMAWSLSGNWDAELLRAEVADRLGWDAVTTLFPEAPTLPGPARPGRRDGERGRRAAIELLRGAPRVPAGQGSNNWVVSGRRSATGKPLLANDPHILVQMPAVWYEIHLSAPGVDVAGVCLPFAPGVILGHNDRIAWGATNVGGDTQDLYLERLSEDGSAALYEGAWEPLTVHREEIEVKGRSDPAVVEVRETRHGPILDSYTVGMLDLEVVEGGIRDALALRWVGFEAGVQSSTVHRMNTAGTFEEFRAALRGWECPGQNFVYADTGGDIGYQCTGLHPIRRRGDGSIPVPGWTAEHEWVGFVPFEELPWAHNPEEGFLATANAKPHDDSYPYLLGRDFIPPFRARRLAQLLTERPLHDVASFARMQADTVSLPAMDLVPRLLEASPEGERQARALELLAGWDFDLAAGSAPAAIYQVWCIHLAEAILLPRLGVELYEHFYARRQWSNEFQTMVLPRLLEAPTAEWFGQDGREARDAVLRRSLDRALDELASKLGQDMDSWAWGDLHHARFVARLGAAVPDLAEVFTGGDAPHGGDEQTVNQGAFEPGTGRYDVAVVASWRQIIDLADLDRSVGTLTVGQSGNPASPHYADQFPLWSSGRHHPMPFTRPAVEAATESVLTLAPEA
jgi:penicillin G amidase